MQRSLPTTIVLKRPISADDQGGKGTVHETVIIEPISKMFNGSISASGSYRNPQNINIYSCGYDPSPSLISNHFPIFEIGSKKISGLESIRTDTNLLGL